ncbi:TPA: hypothetical protein ACH3X1_016616 [Trebouxia sp. C0004]
MKRNVKGDWRFIIPNKEVKQHGLVSAVMNAYEQGQYLPWTWASDDGLAVLPGTVRKLWDVREAYKAQEWGWEYTRGYQDYRRGTLVLWGSESSTTSTHVDWTIACNIAFATTEVPLGTVLSVWALYNPIVMDRVNAWVKTHKRKQRGLGARLVLSEDDLKQMRVDLGVDQKTQISHVQIITQAHGELITVPTGHAHQVVNKQPCIKLAWD